MIIDSRYHELAKGLTGFSCELKKGERVLIDAFDVPEAMVIALIRATRALGAHPYVNLHKARVSRELMLGAEAGPLMPCTMGFRRFRCAQLQDGRAEQWWLGIRLHCRMNWLFLNSNGCGANDQNQDAD
jgi:hypothetical protein